MNRDELEDMGGVRAVSDATASKTVEYYLGLPYTIELWRAPEGGWVVQVKELPGCVSQGETAEEALAMIQDAMEGWLAVALEMGDQIPEPRAEESFSGKFMVRMTRSLHRQVVEQAEREGVSLNQYMNTTLAIAVGAAQANPASALAPQPAPVDSLWPGLHSVMHQVLVSAGYAAEAGALDEHLFAEWFDKMMAQVEAALKGDYGRDAIGYLDQTIGVLHIGAKRSPAVASLLRVCLTLRRQIEVAYAMQRGVLGQLHLSVASYAQQTNSIFVQQQLVQEESAPYAFEPAAFARQRQSDW